MPGESCTEVASLLDAYVDGTLAPIEVGAVEEHVGRCTDCAAAVGRLRTVDRLLVALARPGPTVAEWSALLERTRPRTFAWPRLVAAVLVTALVPASLEAWLVRRDMPEGYDVFTPGIDSDL